MWCAAQQWLGCLAAGTTGLAGALGHFTAVRDTLASRGPSPALVDGLGGRAAVLLNIDRIPEAAEDARRALALARGIGYPAGEALALLNLSLIASYTEDHDSALAWARQAHRIDPASIPGWYARLCGAVLTDALTGAGEAAAAQRTCADALARARLAGALQDQAYCLELMADLDRQAGRMSDAGAHLGEALELATRIGDRLRLLDCLNDCGRLCAATQRWAEAVTAWAAYAARLQDDGMVDLPHDMRDRQEPMRKAGQALGSDRMSAAKERGAAMTLATAAEYAALLVASERQQPAAAGPGLPRLSARERQLVTLVAQGRTDAQIAGQLFISVRTVRSHLDRIRDKTGCRRRADLTRLALQASLV